MWVTAGLGFSSQEQVDVEEGFSPSFCSTTPIQAKSFDVKINVAICFEQGGTDLQMHVHEWQLCKLKDIIATGQRSQVHRLVCDLHFCTTTSMAKQSVT